MRKEYKRSLIKFSNYSLCVTLPKAMLTKMNLDKGDEVMITLKRGKLVIEPAQGTTSNTKSNKNETWEPLPELTKDSR
jgi:antitoxin component of MazEF toxin-antitoxin module